MGCLHWVGEGGYHKRRYSKGGSVNSILYISGIKCGQVGGGKGIKYFGDIECVWSQAWSLSTMPLPIFLSSLSSSILTCDVVLDQSSTPLLRRRISRKCGEVQLLSPLSPLGEQSACLPACLPACLGAMLRRREREGERSMRQCTVYA